MKALELAAYVVNKCVNDPSLSITKGMRTKSWNLNEVIYGIYSPTNYCSIKTV